jgi:hypothetical protein
MAVPSRIRIMRGRGKGGDARSRTPSPMYLDLQAPQADVSESGGHTPRESGFSNGIWSQGDGSQTPWDTSKGRCPKFFWDPVDSNAKTAADALSGAEFFSRGSLCSDHGEAAGKWYAAAGQWMSPQEQVWSAIPAAPHSVEGCMQTGYQMEFNTMHGGVTPPYRMPEKVSSTFPRAYEQGRHTNESSHGANYLGYAPLDSEVPQASFARQWQVGNQLREAVDIIDVTRAGSVDLAMLVPAPPQPLTGVDAIRPVPSLGSRGHPTSCEKGCKYAWKKKGCRDGVNCERCHLCRPNKGATGAQQQASNSSSQTKGQQRSEVDLKSCPVSVGSIGHPHSCAPACKYNGKKAGCKDGQLCDRCHLCRWTRCTDRAVRDANVGAEVKAKPASATREISTQTTVDQSTQCDMDEEDNEVPPEAPEQFPDFKVERFCEFGQVHMSFSC